ncbi:MAG: hypothetical protein IJZ94_04855 [Clostridia bacterium]|nr:hypothetical protein [Clostridia bacterium]
MGAFIGSVIVIIIASFISYFAKRRIEETLFISFVFISFTLYIFGMMGTLIAGVFATVIISLLCILFFAVYLSIDKNKVQAKIKDVFRYVLTPGLAVFLFLTVFFVILNYGREYYLNDEFSHWGFSIKTMFALDNFYCVPEASGLFKDYPPFATLVCYFWSAVTGSFNESYTFTGMGLLMFSCLMPFFKKFSFKDKKTVWLIPLAVTLCFALTAILKMSVFTILAVDTLLALIPVYVFLIYFVRDEGSEEKKDVISICSIIFITVALAALALTKSIGIGFSAFVIVLLTADMIFFERQSSRPKKILLTVCPILSFVIAFFSWKTVLKSNEYISDGSGVKETLNNLYEMVFRTDELSAYRKQTVDSFIEAAFEGRFAFGISLFAIFIILVLLGATLVILVRKDKKKAGRYAVLLTSVVVAFILYLKAILFTFVYKFTEYEAVNLASYERYIGTFLTMWLLLTGVLYFNELYEVFVSRVFLSEKKSSVILKKVITAVSVLSILLLIVFYLLFYPYSSEFSSEQRLETNHAASIGQMYDIMKKQDSSVDASEIKICYVTTLEETRDLLIADYNASPFSLSFDKEWYNNIDKYDYIYVDSVTDEDRTWIETFSVSSGDKEVRYRTVYRIISQSDGYILAPFYAE